MTAGSGPHCDFNREHRGESPMQTLDRNWICLLQELRVVQTGVQLLTGFLLILPFQDLFDYLPAYGRAVYMATLASAVTATILLVAPVAMHRMLFRRKVLGQLVRAGHRSVVAGSTFLGMALTGVVILVSEVVISGYAAVVGGVFAVSAFVVLWVVVPLRMRPREDQ
ncbi:sodium:proton antiporter [Rhodococcus fascians]|nr:sodium:proton antiporter [Rhodococcus fascians]